MNQATLKQLARQYVANEIGDVEFLHGLQVPTEIQQRMNQLIEMPHSVHYALKIEDVWPQKATTVKVAQLPKAKVAKKVSSIETPYMAKRRYWTKLEEFAEGLLLEDDDLEITEVDSEDPDDTEYAFHFAHADHASKLHAALSQAGFILGYGLRYERSNILAIDRDLLAEVNLPVPQKILREKKAKGKAKAKKANKDETEDVLEPKARQLSSRAR